MKGKVIGDILVVKKEPEDIDEIIKLPYINNIVKLGSIHGQKREPEVEMIYGNNIYKLKRYVTLPVLIFFLCNYAFAGIGYFTIPMAVHSRPKKIYAVEINPISYNFLCENIKLNKVEDIVEPILGDCSKQNFDHIADRIMMGYIGGTHHYLDNAMNYLKKGGIIHYHESTPEPILFERPVKRVRESAEKAGRNIEVLNKRSIKKYSPGVYHTVVDIKVN